MVTAPLVVLVVVVMLLIGGTGGSAPEPTPSTTGSATAAAPLPAITVAAPPSDAASSGPCTKVLEQLPVTLGGLAPRAVHPQPDSPFVVAWGDPPVVLRCGVDRPKELVAQSAADTPIINGVLWLVTAENPDEPEHSGDHTYTVVDRPVYIQVTVPESYSQPPLSPLSEAIAKALPTAVCQPQAAAGQTTPEDELCTRRR